MTSFISKEFIDAYGLKCKPLDWPIMILTAGGTILVTQQRLKQVLIICAYEYYANLFVIPMRDIAIILGMDWLVSHWCVRSIENKKNPTHEHKTSQDHLWDGSNY
jgi:hypothetical protein